MIYKLSNVAEKGQVEKELELDFKYPNLYRPRLVINGLEETNLSIVTSQDTHQISLAIWGLMQSNYKEDWNIFQNLGNTLNVDINQLQNIGWMKRTLKSRRCLIVVTGYFCYLLRRNKVYTYYVSMPEEEPFFLGGIWNKLNDGFLSCAVITTKTNKFMSSFHNVDNLMPLIIPESVKEIWLSEETERMAIEKIIQNPPKPKLRVNPIANDFFKKNIIYDSILQPVYYDDIPEGGESSY